MITLSRWRYLWNFLAAFLIGSLFAFRYAAASWFKPVASILTVVLIVGYFFVYIVERQQKIKDRKP